MSLFLQTLANMLRCVQLRQPRCDRRQEAVGGLQCSQGCEHTVISTHPHDPGRGLRLVLERRVEVDLADSRPLSDPGPCLFYRQVISVIRGRARTGPCNVMNDVTHKRAEAIKKQRRGHVGWLCETRAVIVIVAYWSCSERREELK
jgi:hypothetical protein